MIKAGVDWGSSSLRAYRIEDGQVTDSVTSDRGIKTFTAQNSDSAFEETLFELIGEWLQPGDRVLLSGMITSVNGWVETPYLQCPVNCSALASKLTRRSVRQCDLYFVPGVCQITPQPDVMRGEELQLLGANNQTRSTLIIMPGTHSKWAQLTDSTINQFRTIVTGELFDVVRNQTLIGQLANGTDWVETAFINGVEQGFSSLSIISELFSCRSAVLLKQKQAADIHSYLSGLLIGNEISEGLTMASDHSAISLIGSDSLCTRYRIALTHLKLNVTDTNEDSTPDAAAAGYLKLMADFNQADFHE